MWSFGCMAAELFLGLPLFPGACEHDLLERILDFFNYPPADMLREGANVKKFFVEDPNAERGIRLRTKEEFEKFTKAPYLKGMLDLSIPHPSPQALGRSRRRKSCRCCATPCKQWSPFALHRAKLFEHLHVGSDAQMSKHERHGLKVLKSHDSALKSAVRMW